MRADQLFLILHRELYYRHAYSRLQPDIDDRFHSYENTVAANSSIIFQVRLALERTLSDHIIASQIRRTGLYHFSSPNNGYGTSSTSLSISSSPFTCGA